MGSATLAGATLHELASARDVLDAMLADAEGELTPEIEAAWTTWDEKFAEKIERTALYTVELLSHAKSLKAEEDRLVARRKALEHKAEWLKTLMHGALVTTGKKEVKGLLCTVAIQKNPASVVPMVELDQETLRNFAMVSPDFTTCVPESYVLNKRAILDALKTRELTEDELRYVSVRQSEGLRIR